MKNRKMSIRVSDADLETIHTKAVEANMSVTDYHKATGLEAVVGYLYLTGQHERLEEIFERILENG